MTAPAAEPPSLLAAHWRPLAAAVAGVAAGLAAARIPLLDRHPLLIGSTPGRWSIWACCGGCS